MLKPGYVICEQQTRTSAQSAQTIFVRLATIDGLHTIAIFIIPV